MTLIKVYSFRSVYDLRGNRYNDPISKLQQRLIEEFGRDFAEEIWRTARWSTNTDKKFTRMTRKFLRKRNKHLTKKAFEFALGMELMNCPYADETLEDNAIYAKLDEKGMAMYLNKMSGNKFDKDLEELLK